MKKLTDFLINENVTRITKVNDEEVKLNFSKSDVDEIRKHIEKYVYNTFRTYTQYEVEKIVDILTSYDLANNKMIWGNTSYMELRGLLKGSKFYNELPEVKMSY